MGRAIQFGVPFMARKIGMRKRAAAASPTNINTASISAWEDDPESGVLVTRPIPKLDKTPLAFSFSGPRPAPAVYQPSSAEFRYWTAAEALRRGADFWAPRVPGCGLPRDGPRDSRRD